jgi:cytochrome c oxidase subunit 2
MMPIEQAPFARSIRNRHARDVGRVARVSWILVGVCLLGCRPDVPPRTSYDPADDTRPTSTNPTRRANPLPPLDVRVTGDAYRWRITYAGADRRLDTADDVIAMRHVHLPAHTEVTIELDSQDYVYSFFVPDCGLMDVCVPGKPFRLTHRTGSPGSHELLGSQMCGYDHPELLADVVIHPYDEFAAWLDERKGISRIENHVQTGP